MQGSYVVAAWEGRVSVRFEADNSTTIYMDETIGRFDTETEALEYAKEVEPDIWQEYVHSWTCERCGEFSCGRPCYC